MVVRTRILHCTARGGPVPSPHSDTTIDQANPQLEAFPHDGSKLECAPISDENNYGAIVGVSLSQCLSNQLSLLEYSASR